MKLLHICPKYWCALDESEMQALDDVMEQNPTARVKINKHTKNKSKPSVALFESFDFSATYLGAGYWLNVYRKLFQLGL